MSEDSRMRANRRLRILFCIASAGLVAVWMFATSYAQQPRASVEIDNDDIGGVVTGPKGPEAGVWVIAETRDMQSRYIKSVVTDDQGRYVLPDLPKANYTVWARGYGLVDSDKTTSAPGRPVLGLAKLASYASFPRKYSPLRKLNASPTGIPSGERRRSASAPASDPMARKPKRLVATTYWAKRGAGSETRSDGA